MSVTLRVPAPHDSTFLQNLYASTRADELNRMGWSAAQQQAFVQMQYQAQRQSYLMQFPDAEYRIIQHSATDVGRLIVDRTADVLWLIDISLLPEHRNAGLGAGLIRNLQAEAARAGKPVMLHVDNANRARHLYERLGFVKTAEDEFYAEMAWRSGAEQVWDVVAHGFENPLTAVIGAFLGEIGLDVRAGTVGEQTFLPGIKVDHGGLLVDEATLKQPGDLLHEAGHLAVMPPQRRRRAHIDVGQDAAEEMMAIAWSYAALVHLKLDPAVVFHPDGYRGGAQALIENFTGGRTIGVPMLQWLGMTVDARRAAETGSAAYPAMLKWLCDE